MAKMPTKGIRMHKLMAAGEKGAANKAPVPAAGTKKNLKGGGKVKHKGKK